MKRSRGPVILSVDDDPAVLTSVERILSRRGYDVRTAGTPGQALAMLEQVRPDLILLDVVMPEMSGYELCRTIHENPELAFVPVLFLTVLGEEDDRTRAFAAGAADVLLKPFDVHELGAAVGRHLENQARWEELRADSGAWSDWVEPRRWLEFRDFLKRHLSPELTAARALERAGPADLYALAPVLGLSERALAQYVADFLGASFVAGVDPETVVGGLLPTPFCRSNLIVPVRGEDGELAALVANPFRWELLDGLRRIVGSHQDPPVLVTEPEAIRAFFSYGEGGDAESAARAGEAPAGGGADVTTVIDADEDPDEGAHEVIALANEILRRAVADRASDIHLEPKEDHALVRFRVDGDLNDVRRIARATSTKLIARFKAVAELDIAEKRKPQDGALEAQVHGRKFTLRVATTVTPSGESLVMRLIEPGTRPPTLDELGMTPEQGALMRTLAARSQGLILVVGPTGCGKSTTIFSLLSHVDGRRRSIMTAEDPVEYRIPHANQQQVNERAGVTFEALLRSAVRQDPDILLLGEMRDLFSAKASLDFAASGHLTVSTLHTSNATTAVFRLERLGVPRGAMADAVLGIVAQKLLKRLCEHCKRVRPITREEREALAPYTDLVPDRVAEPTGCPACRRTGYAGRTGVYEILRFDRSVAEMVRRGASVAELRGFVQERGDFLISRHAVEKVRDLLISVADAYEHVLLEEPPAMEPRRASAAGVSAGPGVEPGAGGASPASPPVPLPAVAGAVQPISAEAGAAPEILVVEDDLDTRTLLERLLRNAGYRVVLADDGVAALLHLGRTRFDAVLSDINMPNLDGLKLLEVMSQKGVDTPVIFLTAQTGEDFEVKGLELGAADFLTKPVQKDILRLRLRRVLSGGGAAPAAVSA